MVEQPGGGKVADAMQSLDSYLDGVSQELAASSERMGASVVPAPPGRLYTTITRHWPRIAAGFVTIAVAAEWLIGGLTANGALEVYLTAWAASTAGIWFLFNKAEKSLSPAGRATVVEWLAETDLRSSIGSIPAQFALLFDKVFGERHLTLSCLMRSSVASVGAIGVMLALWVAFNSPLAELSFETRPAIPQVPAPARLWFVGVPMAFAGQVAAVVPDWETIGYRLIDVLGLVKQGSAVLVLAILFNLIPDYLSLWETRAVLGWMAKRKSYAKAMLFDLILTFGISMSAVFAGSWILFSQNPLPRDGLEAERGSVYVFPPRVGVDASLRSQIRTRSGVRYPSGTMNKTGYLMREVVTLEPRFGTLLMPVVPIVDRLEIDDRSFERWPLLQPPEVGTTYSGGYPVRSVEQDASAPGGRVVTMEPGDMGLPFGLFFYSAFFTSIWLWLYVAAVTLSRGLLRMNNGVGLLIRVTDVEQQPFRSIGFVCVIVASAAFALGLPLVLL